jgi:membrane-associated phospholipid phosphatase
MPMPSASPCFAGIGLEFTLKWLRLKPLPAGNTDAAKIAHCRVAPLLYGTAGKITHRLMIDAHIGFAQDRLYPSAHPFGLTATLFVFLAIDPAILPALLRRWIAHCNAMALHGLLQSLHLFL